MTRLPDPSFHDKKVVRKSYDKVICTLLCHARGLCFGAKVTQPTPKFGQHCLFKVKITALIARISPITKEKCI